MTEPPDGMAASGPDVPPDPVRIALQELEDLGSLDAIEERLTPWSTGATAIDRQNCALARYLQWRLALSTPVDVDAEHAQISGRPRVRLPRRVAAFQARSSKAAPADSPSPQVAGGSVEDQIRGYLQQLENLGSTAAIAGFLDRWRSGAVPGDRRRSALARYLQWSLALGDVAVDAAYAQIPGHAWVRLPPHVARYQASDGEGPRLTQPIDGPGIPPSPLQVVTDEALRARVEDSKPSDTRIGLITFGLLLAIVGAIVLVVPFINLDSSTTTSTAATISLFSANGICSSGLGELAQGASSQFAQTCGNVTLGFFGSWAAIVLGAGLFLAGLLRG